MSRKRATDAAKLKSLPEGLKTAPYNVFAIKTANPQRPRKVADSRR